MRMQKHFLCRIQTRARKIKGERGDRYMVISPGKEGKSSLIIKERFSSHISKIHSCIIHHENI
jgi:hypothetical protein